MRKASEFAAEALSNDDELRRIHLEEAFGMLFTSEYQVAFLMLRDIIKATCGFEVLGREIEIPPKSIMRMLTETSNPQSINLLKIIHFLVEQEGGAVKVKFAA